MSRPRFQLSKYVVWRYKYGSDYKFFFDLNERKQGQPDWVTPVALTDLPDMDDLFDMPYVDAFYMLDSSRQSGQGVGYIPLSEILSLHGHLRLGAPEEFVSIIQAADAALVKAYYDDPKNKPK